MGLMYMKSVLSCKPDHESSVVAEAGSEHCDSDGHETDHENTDDNNPKVQVRDQVEVRERERLGLFAVIYFAGFVNSFESTVGF